MSVKKIDLRSITVQPWRNGGGVTRELLARPAGGAWRVRVSVADIDRDGPFSAYPGVARWLAVVDGAGVELQVDDRRQRLTRLDPPLAFAGDAATTCRLLAGPTRDLNLMLRGATGFIQQAGNGVPWTPGSEQCGLFSAVAGRVQAEAQSIAPFVDVTPDTLLWFDPAPSALVFSAAHRSPTGVGWWLAATPEAAPV